MHLPEGHSPVLHTSSRALWIRPGALPVFKPGAKIQKQKGSIYSTRFPTKVFPNVCISPTGAAWTPRLPAHLRASSGFHGIQSAEGRIQEALKDDRYDRMGVWESRDHGEIRVNPKNIKNSQRKKQSTVFFLRWIGPIWPNKPWDCRPVDG